MIVRKGDYDILRNMLNLDFICQHPDVVRDALQKRHEVKNVDDILRLAEQRRGIIMRSDGLYTSLKKLKESSRSASAQKQTVLNEQIKAVTEDIRQLEIQSEDTSTRLHLLLLSLPNLPHTSVKEGSGTAVGEEVKRWSQPISFHFEPQSHWDLGAQLGVIDVEAGTKIAGSNFVALKGLGARLERALISFMLDIHTREHGYTEILPPLLAKRSAMFGAGQLPKFEDQSYAYPEEELYLNPTAEVPLIGMHSDSVLVAESLPLRYVAWTTAFRRETGSSMRQQRGLLGLHQFNKVELFQYVLPQESYSTLDAMVQHAEKILQLLDLPYRVVELYSPHLPFTAAKTFNIEVWMPGQKDFIEISSISNCETFQTQRAGIKDRLPGDMRLMYPHTLSASGLVVGRTMAALLETYQQADGSVVIPKVLRPYMGTSHLMPVI